MFLQQCEVYLVQIKLHLDLIKFLANSALSIASYTTFSQSSFGNYIRLSIRLWIDQYGGLQRALGHLKWRILKSFQF